MQKKEVSHVTATRMQEVCSVGEGHTYTEFQWEGQIVISPDSQGSRGRPSHKDPAFHSLQTDLNRRRINAQSPEEVVSTSREHQQ